MEAASHSHPQSFQVAITVVLEQLKREELKKQKKGLKHTFASYARPSASHLFTILSNWVVRYSPARSTCNVVSCYGQYI
jgi:hypothetical protein